MGGVMPCHSHGRDCTPLRRDRTIWVCSNSIAILRDMGPLSSLSGSNILASLVLEPLYGKGWLKLVSIHVWAQSLREYEPHLYAF